MRAIFPVLSRVWLGEWFAAQILIFILILARRSKIMSRRETLARLFMESPAGFTTLPSSVVVGADKVVKYHTLKSAKNY